MFVKKLVFVLLLSAVTGLSPSLLSAHCDTLEGPVIVAAKKALQSGKVDPVLIWVQKSDEAEIKEVFDHTLKVRVLGPEAQILADRFFFETLVRIHRAGEGEPYTGLKPEGTKVDPMIAVIDNAVDQGSVDDLVSKITKHISSEINEQFEKVAAAKKTKDASIAQGRKYVAAYVTFVHFIEGIHQAVAGTGENHNQAEKKPAHKH